MRYIVLVHHYALCNLNVLVTFLRTMIRPLDNVMNFFVWNTHLPCGVIDCFRTLQCNACFGDWDAAFVGLFIVNVIA